MRLKETLIAFSLVAVMVVAMGQSRRVIRGSSWFEQNISTLPDAATVRTAVGAQTGSANLTNLDANLTMSGTNVSLPGTVTAGKLASGNSYLLPTELSVATSQDTNYHFKAVPAYGGVSSVSLKGPWDYVFLLYGDTGKITTLGVDAGTTIIQPGVTTDNPSGGTAAQWKLGSLVTGATVTLVTTNYIQVDIGGTAYKLAIVH